MCVHKELIVFMLKAVNINTVSRFWNSFLFLTVVSEISYELVSRQLQYGEHTNSSAFSDNVFVVHFIVNNEL